MLIILASEQLKKVRNFTKNLQNSDDTGGVHVNKLPSNHYFQAIIHLDQCLDYMEIVDKMLVDAIPKVFIMMLVMNFLDFVKGGKIININHKHSM